MGVPILLSSKTQENFVTVWSRHTAAEWRFDMETKKNNGISEYGELVRQKRRASELTEENLAERIEMSDRQHPQHRKRNNDTKAGYRNKTRDCA